MSIEVKNLSFAYGDRQVLYDISFSAHKGEFLSILGPNGVGKSTLFRCVLGLLSGYTGQVLVDGMDARTFSVKEAFAVRLFSFATAFSPNAFILNRSLYVFERSLLCLREMNLCRS
jgi:iron complex transport system ATP-binding protein